MPPNRRKGAARAAAVAAAAAQQQWKIGDLVLAKMKGFPAWPAMISEPEKWGFSSDRKKLLVYFYGTKQIAFCNHADIEAFTEEKKKSLLIKRQGKGADFVRAVEEIIDVYETLKKQNLAGTISNDGEDAANASNQEASEDSRSHCFAKTAEHSLSPSLNHQSEGAPLKEDGGKLNVDVNPGPLDDGTHNKNTITDDSDSAKNISILDQLRQIPLSTIPTTRKRARDALLPCSVTKSAASLRRSRSSLANNPCKSQKSLLQVDAKLYPDCSASIVLPEDLTPNEEVVVRGEDLAVCSSKASPVSTVPFENASPVKNDGTNLDVGNEKEFSGKSECPDNDTDSNTAPEKDTMRNTKFEIPVNTYVIKARRKPCRKNVTSARTSDEMDTETDAQVGGGSHSDSLNFQNGINDKFSNADGDEHLPLVKRARVRMGKPTVEEENLNEPIESKVKSCNLATSNGHYENTTFASSVKNCLMQNGPSKRISPVAKEFSRSSTNDNGSALNITGGGDLLSCKLNKRHLILDVEAALPPSKRLHRALEAMSANAAEAAIDCPQEPNETEIKSSNCLGSSTENASSADENVRCPAQPIHAQTSGTTASENSVCDLSLSEVQPDDAISAKMLISNKAFSEKTVKGRYLYHDSSTSKITRNLQSSSLELDEKHCGEFRPNYSCSPAMKEMDRSKQDKECAYSECVRVSPNANGTCSSQLAGLSPSSAAATTISNSASEIDGCTVGSDNANVDSLAGDLNGISSVSSAINLRSLASDRNEVAAASVVTNFRSAVNDTSMATFSRPQLEQTSLLRDMQNVAWEVKKTPKDMSILSKLAPIKDLIAAAQAKRFVSRSASFCESVRDGNIAPDAAVSPTLVNKKDSSGRSSPSNPVFHHRSASDEGSCYLQNGSRTPLDGSSRKGFSKFANHSEANAARRCFESLLCTLSRTKDSIGRATRLAIDCAKFGIAGEVIDILLQYLEKESSLHRRVDLFFLVDSITQCSRTQKGGPGDVYPSLVQAVLPRLLSAAAPPGNAASENRRQCLKVLRLWLERRTLPEFTVRHHIRELEYGSEASLSISYSRRPPRTERPLNDPVREMEGMLVDEYGSNASFQLPQFLSTRIMEDDEGSASDEKGFEAVTPDSNTEIDHEKRMTPKSAEKHCLVLEEVDGELEMEDVAPSDVHEGSQSACQIKGTEIISNINHKCEQTNILSFAPPLPEERPPSPPPLPSSPPPLPPPPCSTPTGQAPQPPQSLVAGLTASADNTDFATSYAAQNQILRPINQQPSSAHCSSSLSEPTAFYPHGVYVGHHPQQMPQLVSSCTSSGSYAHTLPSMPVGNNSQSIVNMTSGTKVYHLQPPPPVVSNQFSYIQAQPQHRTQAPLSQPAFSDSFHHSHDNQRGNFYGDGATRAPVLSDSSERSAFYPSVCAGPIGSAPDKVEASLGPVLYGTNLDSSATSSQDWSYHSRTPNYPASSSRQSLENPVSGVVRAPAYWRAR